MTYEAINFGKTFRLFHEQWQPKVVAEMNDYQFKIVRLEGDFIWHDHKNTDETFIVLEGVLRIDFRDGAVHLWTGEMFVVPKGVALRTAKNWHPKKREELEHSHLQLGLQPLSGRLNCITALPWRLLRSPRASNIRLSF